MDQLVTTARPKSLAEKEAERKKEEEQKKKVEELQHIQIKDGDYQVSQCFVLWRECSLMFL